MKPLFFDTETSGLPLYKEPSEDPRQPHIVEIAALLHNDAGALVDQFHAIIRPDGWVIPDEVAAIHGITTERAMDEGIPEHEALRSFLALWARADIRVAHNESFDQRILRIGLKRFGNAQPGWEKTPQEHKDIIADRFKAAPAYCTMKASTKPCGLPPTPAMLAKNMRWNKNPSLTEAHQHFFGTGFDGAHSALDDAQACARVYYALNPVAAVA
jgi:DNA polymerase-3 subunit epsilon